MPLSPDPSAVARFAFETIDGRRIDYQTRFLTRRQRLAHERLEEELYVKGEGDDAGTLYLRFDEVLWPKIDAMLAIGTDYTVEGLADSLTERDIVALAQRYPAAAAMGEDELGKHKSRRLFVQGSSAATAGADAAPTPQP